MPHPAFPAAALVVIALLAHAAPRAAAADDGRATLRGVAQGANGPDAEAEVAAGIIGWAPAAGDHVAVVRTDAEGRFALAKAPLGPIDVWVRPKGGKWTFALRMEHPGVNDLLVDSREKRDFRGMGFGDEGGKGTVTGVVSDKAGKPLAGAAVGLRGDDTTWVLTDDEGQFTLEGAAKGDGIAVRATGYRDATDTLRSEKQKCTFKLEPARITVVRVNDPAGKPLAGAWVVLGDPGRVQAQTGFSALFPPRARLLGGWTDEKGDARVPWGDPEAATVATAYASGFAPASKKVTAGKGVVLQVAAQRPARVTVVRRDDGSPVAGVYVGLPHESDGGPDAISALPQSQERGPVVVGRTDEKGQCVIAHLPEGVDSVRIVGEMKIHATAKVERIRPDAAK